MQNLARLRVGEASKVLDWLRQDNEVRPGDRRTSHNKSIAVMIPSRPKGVPVPGTPA